MVVFRVSGRLAQCLPPFLRFFFVGPRADLDLYRRDGMYLSVPDTHT